MNKYDSKNESCEVQCINEYSKKKLKISENNSIKNVT